VDPGNEKKLKTKSITHSLLNAQICTIDTPTDKNLAPDRCMHGINLQQKKSRKIYFTSYQQMTLAMNRLLAVQGFTGSRAA